MIHLGDITKIDGSRIPVVDIVTGGSPCQDLSVAGKREGLAGERSGLFMEQIRIIKEMREHDRSNGRSDQFIRPRYMVWENVPGALSSGVPKGEDFRIVLEETARVADPAAVIPRPEGGRWSHSGCIMGPGWSIAWRLHDAQFWGVPQRRKRIALVADFNGQSAPEILFERKGSTGDSEPGEEEGKDAPQGTGRSTCFPGTGVTVLENHPNDSRVKICDDNIFQTLSSRMGTWGGNTPMILEPIVFRDDITIKVDDGVVAFTLGARDFKGVQCVRAERNGNN